MSRIAYLTAVDFGPGELKTLATAPAELGMKRPLLVADKGIAAAGLVAKAAAAFLPSALWPTTRTRPTREWRARPTIARCWARRWRRPSRPGFTAPVFCCNVRIGGYAA